MVANFNEIPDVQGHADTREIAIQRVGIKDLRHPITVHDRSGAQHTVATVTMAVHLPEHLKGTHMSRFVQILNEQEFNLSVDYFRSMLAEMRQRLESESGYVEMTFPFFVRKKAPVTGVESVLDYSVTFMGEIDGDQTQINVKLVAPVTSLCPCSKKISDYGAHNQRSHVTINARIEGEFCIEELIELAEKEASCELYSLLKRPDEKYVTEKAYDNPKFVEDMIRDIACQLNKEERIRAYCLEVENFEAIHNHSAYAMIELDKDV